MEVAFCDNSFSTARENVCDGLALLFQAYAYARDLKCDIWDFSVEIWCLRAAGVANFDLRWMVKKGLVDHAAEVTKNGDEKRAFQHDQGMVFTDRSCFALTEIGIATTTALVEPVSEQMQNIRFRTGSLIVNGNGSHRLKLPKWDSERHQLRFGESLVKEYKVPSPNQEAILMAFEEEGWPPRIHDPISPIRDVNPKQRLRNTIKSLNRNQVSQLIRFMGDGTGEAIRWEAISTQRNGIHRP
ncbi:MAG: hypothetical protein GTO53_07880 [Planctomycetales bacterium]|nr:hypothetical protein [Planctomycetales bacterium]NIM09055.1 hypothetical protein [Planctomycetales bacterium]NIN08518.1 hypothetical protein [Planctomycetales bacterium]NIN77652.1 hypothetical protein [Planctomycetales bacterium]NIO34815.1 hypothetical protein [Planctomycetales bacterium]